MTKPRKQLVAIEDTPYYHVTSRCVRRAFLCGTEGGKCYEHRRQWLVDRIRLLSSLFAIDICSYAVMSNHYHIALKLSPEQADDWTEDEVIERWLTLFKGHALVQHYVAGLAQSIAERDQVQLIVTEWRRRLGNISWFMKCLNQPIARAANIEDNCTGHFWESRFCSQALLSEQALLTCMSYVDLNPIRAQMADTPENSDYTSIQERISPTFDLTQAIRGQSLNNTDNIHVKPLLYFEDNIRNEAQKGILFSMSDYLQLVDWTGKMVRNNKRGSIPSSTPPILTRLNIPVGQWMIDSQQFEKVVHRRFRTAA